jgi:hypothetical protein
MQQVDGTFFGDNQKDKWEFGQKSASKSWVNQF